jgi:branched-chain amino acid transport system ATP-binding protein
MSGDRPGLLKLQHCTIRFGGLTAVSALDLEVGEQELVGLIGPNGAGKTTVFNLITGVYQPTEGEILLSGRSIVGKKPFQITEQGIARTFQNIRLFPSLSVFDNVRVAFHLHLVSGISHALWRGRGFVEEEKAIEAQVMEILEIFRLGRHRNAPAKSLPYGDQRRLEIVRALATRPKLLLLDEPAAGMNPNEKAELMKLIQFIKDKYRIAVLLVEHDMQVVMGICERIAVLDYGIKIAEGTPKEVRCNSKVIEAYLGQETPKV